MPHACHSLCLKHGKREKRDLELEKSELFLLCYRFMGFFRYFFKLGSREWLPLPAIPLTCKEDATVKNVAPYGKHKWSILLLRKEEPFCQGGSSLVSCGGPCFRAGRLFCCLHIVMNRKKKKSSIDPVTDNFDGYPKSSICARIRCPLWH